jgi:hypothetical protein
MDTDKVTRDWLLTTLLPKVYQTGENVVNIHRLDRSNPGDLYSSPCLYFEVLENKQMDIWDFESKSRSVLNNILRETCTSQLIIGGGGLLNRPNFAGYMNLFEQLSLVGKKTILWGCGHNDGSKLFSLKSLGYNINLNNFGLVGTRDYGFSKDWVPCPSCLHPIFDDQADETQEVGLILHKKTLDYLNNIQWNSKSIGLARSNLSALNFLLKLITTFPCVSNEGPLEDIVSFIKKSNTIITESYHGMYWAMLLGKKVSVIPNSSKFFDFKYDPYFSPTENNPGFDEVMKNARSYSGVLDECREANANFAEKVFNYIDY